MYFSYPKNRLCILCHTHNLKNTPIPANAQAKVAQVYFVSKIACAVVGRRGILKITRMARNAQAIFLPEYRQKNTPVLPWNGTETLRDTSQDYLTKINVLSLIGDVR